MHPEEVKFIDWMDAVHRFRKQMVETSAWVTPDPVNCVRFATAKMGKALDAWITETQDLAINREDTQAQLFRYLTASAVSLVTPIHSYELEWLGYAGWPTESTMDSLVISMYNTYQLCIAESRTKRVLDFSWRTTAIHTLRLIWVFPDSNIHSRTMEYFTDIRSKFQAR